MQFSNLIPCSRSSAWIEHLPSKQGVTSSNLAGSVYHRQDFSNLKKMQSIFRSSGKYNFAELAGSVSKNEFKQ